MYRWLYGSKVLKTTFNFAKGFFCVQNHIGEVTKMVAGGHIKKPLSYLQLAGNLTQLRSKFVASWQVTW
jgi:hypothetical protein